MTRKSTRQQSARKGKRASWGDWRPYNAAPVAWNANTAFANGSIVTAEIAGQTITTAAIPAVPFDPGSQLIAGAVTLVEEETFEVQVKGHIDVNRAIGPASQVSPLLLQHGLYKARFSAGGGGFILPAFTVGGIADVNWINRFHRVFDMPSQVGVDITVPTRLVMGFNATYRIGQGTALWLAMQASWTGAGSVFYTPFLEYRIRRNVD